ncbi:MAG: rhodanese-like domain-containing protein [Alphaproteobacteria bacterium]
MNLLAGLIALLVAAAAPRAFAEPPQTSTPQSSVRVVSSTTYAKATGGATLIDVREPAEWSDTGMPAEARGVPVSSVDFIKRVLAEVGGDKSKPVAVICKSGSRSTRAAAQLAAAGFTNVTNVGDGMAGNPNVGQGWIASGLTLKPYRAPAAN